MKFLFPRSLTNRKLSMHKPVAAQRHYPDEILNLLNSLITVCRQKEQYYQISIIKLTILLNS